MTDTFTPGVATALSATVRRVVAPNPGVMTGPGTNTYLVGANELAVIDPGPDDATHRQAILAAAGATRVRWILTTHTHPDHAPGAAALREATGGRVFGFEARDGFEPDEVLGDGGEVGEGAGLPLRAVHTPGHASNHLCFLQTETSLLFSGDHVMNGSTVVISPPDGDMAQYLSSLARVALLEPSAIAPGHGGLITTPDAALRTLIEHRMQRESRVVAALTAAGEATIDELVPTVYADVDAARYPIARFSLWAHLRKLVDDGVVATTDSDDIGTRWRFH